MEELQAAVIIAIAACPEVEHRFISAESVRFRFVRKEGLENFLLGINYYQRLQLVVLDLEVIVSYVD
jgi:hypothetical protein